MTLFLFAVFFQSAIGSELIGIETEKIENRTRYILEFDQPVAVYYPRKTKNAFRIDLYGVAPARGMEEKLSALKDGSPWTYDSLPLPLLSLNLPLHRKTRAETFPLGNLLMVEMLPEDDERVWALPNPEGSSGPFRKVGIALYRRESAEELSVTLPENSGHTGFRATPEGCRVEIFGVGLFLDEKTLPVDSRYISKVHQSAIPAGPLSPEGICIYEFAFKKTVRVSHRFLPMNLVVRLEKP